MNKQKKKNDKNCKQVAIDEQRKMSKLDMVAHTCNFNIQEAEAGGFASVFGQPGLHSMF